MPNTRDEKEQSKWQENAHKECTGSGCAHKISSGSVRKSCVKQSARSVSFTSGFLVFVIYSFAHEGHINQWHASLGYLGICSEKMHKQVAYFSWLSGVLLRKDTKLCSAFPGYLEFCSEKTHKLVFCFSWLSEILLRKDTQTSGLLLLVTGGFPQK